MALVLLAAYLGCVALLLFVLLCGESVFFEGTPVQSCHYWITSGLWEALLLGLEAVCGRRWSLACALATDLCCNKPNPITQVFYLTLVFGGYWAFDSTCFDRIPGPYVSSFHRLAAPLAVLASLAAFFAASFCDPGAVTAQNVGRHLASYPFDGVIFTPKDCPTCRIPRPARSKHCSVCDRCVARFDHHCGWMNSCIGADNVRYFLAFLLINWVLCVYGVALIGAVLAGEVRERHVMRAIFAQDRSRVWTVREWAPPLIQWLTLQYSALTMLLVLLAVLVLLLGSFTVYHLNLVRLNMTTNETYKWADYQRWRAYKANVAAEGAAARRQDGGRQKEPEGAAAEASGITVASETGTGGKSPTAQGAGSWCPAGLWTLVAGGRRRPRAAGPGTSRRRSRPADFKTDNVYDRGLIGNVVEVCWPLERRPNAPSVEYKRAKKKKS